MNRILMVVVAAVLLMAGTGCLVTSDSKSRTDGNYVPEATFEQIQAGKTSSAWVQATLGEPSSKTKVEGAGSEIWRWNYKEVKEGSGTVFLIFAGKSEDQKSRAAFVEIKDGVVVRKWRT